MLEMNSRHFPQASTQAPKVLESAEFLTKTKKRSKETLRAFFGNWWGILFRCRYMRLPACNTPRTGVENIAREFGESRLTKAIGFASLRKMSLGGVNSWFESRSMASVTLFEVRREKLGRSRG
jgi:hypothetical protein